MSKIENRTGHNQKQIERKNYLVGDARTMEEQKLELAIFYYAAVDWIRGLGKQYVQSAGLAWDNLMPQKHDVQPVFR